MLKITKIFGRDKVKKEFLINMTSDEKVKFFRFAVSVLRSGSLSYSNCSGPGRIYSRKEFSCLLDRLLRFDLISWVDKNRPTRGVILTDQGQRMLDKVIEDTTPPIKKALKMAGFDWIDQRT